MFDLLNYFTGNKNNEYYTVSDYEVYKNKKLGNGAYSVVYLGKCKNIEKVKLNNLKNDKVAIKKINMLNQSNKVLKMIREEIQIMKNIMQNPHDNIIKCIDIIDDIDCIYFILEYCEGGELYSLLGKPIKEETALNYFKQIFSGLYYLNENKIIHRDIKPKNILIIHNSDNNNILKIADFGLAKIKNNMSRINTVCGSPLYMAPEVLSEKTYDSSVDIWALGLLLYEMIYGVSPFYYCKNLTDLKKSVLYEKIYYDHHILISNECFDILNKMLESDSSKRITLKEIKEHCWLNNGKLENSININLELQLKETQNEDENLSENENENHHDEKDNFIFTIDD